LLGKTPIEASETFAMFALGEGLMMGLWKRDGVEPAATMSGGGAELAIAVGDDKTVDAKYAIWLDRGLKIAQTPTVLDFGYTFVALDPDEHRIRVFAPS